MQLLQVSVNRGHQRCCVISSTCQTSWPQISELHFSTGYRALPLGRRARKGLSMISASDCSSWGWNKLEGGEGGGGKTVEGQACFQQQHTPGIHLKLGGKDGVYKL